MIRVASSSANEKRTKADPMKPAPPVTRSFMSLFVLGFPIVIDAGLIIGRAALVGGIIKTVGHVDQQGRIAADHFIPMRHAGRNQDLPGSEHAGVNRVALAEGG